MKKIGTYILGNERIEIYHNPEADGAYFETIPREQISKPRLVVNCNRQKWHSVLNLFLHEALEFSMFRNGAVFSNYAHYSPASDDRLFVFDHVQFGEIAFMVAYLMEQCYEDLKKQHEAVTMKKKPKGKKKCSRKPVSNDSPAGG